MQQPPTLELAGYTRATAAVPTHGSPYVQCVSIYVPTSPTATSPNRPRTTLLVSHANGFHKEVMLPALQSFVDRVPAAIQRPDIVMWDLRNHGDSAVANRQTHPDFSNGTSMTSWQTFVDDLHTLMLWFRDRDSTQRRWIGVGHSITGAVMLEYQVTHHGFARLIVVEPMVYPEKVEGNFEESPVAVKAEKRRRVFPNRDQVTQALRKKTLFGVFTESAWQYYLWHGFNDVAEGVELKCHPKDESINFGRGPLDNTWDKLGSIKVPVLAMAGASSMLQGSERMETLAKQIPRGEHATVDAGHLWPLEQPERLADALLQAVVAEESRSMGAKL
ncbi:hypothetical protein RI367_002000 [Sorochytrium milnesiophthora]